MVRSGVRKQNICTKYGNSMPRLSHWSELNPMLTSSSSRQASTLLASCFLLRTISFPKYVGTYNRAYRRGILLLRRVVLLLCLLCLPSFRCFGSFRFYTSVVGSLLSRALSSSLFSLSLSLWWTLPLLLPRSDCY